MANVGGKGRLIIRKRAAPNILAKKNNPDTQTSLTADPKVQDKCDSSVINTPLPVPSNNLIELANKSVCSLKADNDSSISCKPIEKPLDSNISKDSICTKVETHRTHPADSEYKLPKITETEIDESSALGLSEGDSTDISLSAPIHVSNSAHPTVLQPKKRATPNVPKTRPQLDLSLNVENPKNSKTLPEIADPKHKVDSQISENAGNDNSIQLKEPPQSTPVTTEESSTNPITLSVEDQVSNSKPSLKRRAAPILPKKRPLPNVPRSSSYVPPNESQRKEDRVKDEVKVSRVDDTSPRDNLPKNEDSFSIQSANKQLEVIQGKHQEQSLPQPKNQVESQCELPQQGMSKIVTSEHQTNALSVTAREHAQLSQGTEETETALEDRKPQADPSSTCLTNKPISSSKELQTKISGNKFIKRRVGPKLVCKTSETVTSLSALDNNTRNHSESLKTDSTNSQEPSHCISKDQETDGNDINVSSEHFSDICSAQLQNIENSSQVGDSESETTSYSQCNVNAAIPTGSQEPEGVVRIYLNCWPQYPLDDLNDDPFFEGRNIKELGKVSVFVEKGHKIAYCDMASTIDFKDVPKNWAFINFNKLIKEEFKEDESEEYQNTVHSYECDDTASDNCFISEPLGNDDGSCSPLHYPESVDGSLLDRGQLAEEQAEADTSGNVSDAHHKQVNNSPKDKISRVKFKRIKVSAERNTKSKECDSTSDDAKSKKPYKLRKVKPLSVKNYEEIEIDSGSSEDIFSNGDDSDVSEYVGESKTKKRKVISTKSATKTQKKTQRKSPKAKKERVVKEKKEKVKKEKEPKSMENASPFYKLGFEVKKKKKWDEEGNCAEPEKLELKDFIFYVPKNEPMTQEKKEMKTAINDEEATEEGVDEDIVEEEEEVEESQGPKLIVKDGKIIVDPTSTKIKQTPVMQFKAEKWERPREANDPWELQETMKFYATLWKYGIDYSMLAGSFPKKSRDALKKKFSFEERYNGPLLGKTLTKKLDLQAVLKEVILIDNLEKLSSKRKKNEKSVKENEKKEKKKSKHRLLHPPKRRKNNASTNINKKPRSESPRLNEDDCSQSERQQWLCDNELIISEDVQTINLKDVITFSTNLIYKDMNIVESVSFHPSEIQPVDINVTICHEPENVEHMA